MLRVSIENYITNQLENGIFHKILCEECEGVFSIRSTYMHWEGKNNWRILYEDLIDGQRKEWEWSAIWKIKVPSQNSGWLGTPSREERKASSGTHFKIT